ncbi:MAG: hypothetical protein NC936_01755 [Candidatus Omnitrophica bacterium]|nr:hypothetical protein [Candidatus Omnitrophota bacterium]
MKKELLGLVLFLGLIISRSWANETEFNCIAVHPKVGGLIFAGSNRNLYCSTDNGRHWKAVLNLKRTVNSLFIDGDIIYVATEGGLFISQDKGQSWKSIYRGWDKSKNILCLAQNKSHIFLGTEKGLLIALKNENNFKKLNCGLAQGKVLSIDVLESVLYVVTERGVFKSIDNGMTFQKMLVISQAEADEVPDEYADDTEEESEVPPRVRSVTLDKNNPQNVYLGTEQGVWWSPDAGKSWQALSKIGLLNKKINFILLVEDRIYAATEKGVYVYDRDEEIWNEAYKGIPATRIKHLAFDKFKNNLWVASDKGVFSFNHGWFLRGGGGDFSDEPTINEVQKMAIEYAEVQPEKIAHWRKQARLKALLPQVSIGWDKSKSDTYEIYTSSSTHYYVTGPKDTSSGWDISASWKLSDLIWGTDQTSIDVRSRLMVQLRNDILEDVTRTYFERRRIQIELLNGTVVDEKKRMEKELRIEELTANLDALTGGKFSRALKKRF